jgi:predicted PurR-regulated permease PerM
MPNPRLSNAVLWLAIIGLSLYLVERFAVITELLAGPLLMFAFAWLIAIIIEPIFEWSASAKIPRKFSVPVVYVLLLSLIVFGVVAIIPIVATQIQGLIEASPELTAVFWATLDDVQAQLSRIGVNSDIKTYFNAETFLSQAGIFGREAFSQTLGAASSIAIVIFNLFIVLILSFYMAFDGQKAFNKLIRLSPSDWRDEVQTFGNIISNTFGGYMRVQIVSSIIYALTNAVVMWFFGLNSITLTTVIVSIIVMVPVVGGVIALIPPIIVILIAGATGTIVPFLVIMLIIQQILFSVILPRMVGRIVGLHPLLVFAALLIGAQIAGPYGILFGTPLAGVAASIANYFYLRTQTVTEPIPTPVVQDEYLDPPA